MKRRAFLQTALAAPAWGLAVGNTRAEAAQWRSFLVTTKIELARASGPARAWVPLPLAPDTDYQKLIDNSWRGNAVNVQLVKEARYGAAMLYAEWQDSEQTPMLEVDSRFSTRDRVEQHRSAPAVASKEEIALYLKPTKLIPTDGLVLETARKIVRAVADEEVAKARAIYDWVVENSFRDSKVKGCGIGDISNMLETGNLGGKCADINSLFVGLCRASGVAARDVYGIRVADSRWGFKSLGKSGAISKAQHCRAEFYAAGYGWIPVDPADVRKVVLEEPPGNLPVGDAKVAAARKRLFGGWEMNWLAYNMGHDIGLPGASGPKLPYLMYINAQTGGQMRDQLDPDGVKYTITSREV